MLISHAVREGEREGRGGGGMNQGFTFEKEEFF